MREGCEPPATVAQDAGSIRAVAFVQRIGKRHRPAAAPTTLLTRIRHRDFSFQSEVRNHTVGWFLQSSQCANLVRAEHAIHGCTAMGRNHERTSSRMTQIRTHSQCTRRILSSGLKTSTHDTVHESPSTSGHVRSEFTPRLIRHVPRSKGSTPCWYPAPHPNQRSQPTSHQRRRYQRKSSL